MEPIQKRPPKDNDQVECEKALRELAPLLEDINYKEVNIESWYQELLEKERTEIEEIIFRLMDQIRKDFSEIEEKHHLRTQTITLLAEKCNFNPKIRYFDWDSRPIHSWEYNFKYTFFPKHVGDDLINGWRVSTVWLGLNHAFFANHPPQIFETMIFNEEDRQPKNEELDHFQERYAYFEEAVQGHKQACDMVRRVTNER